MDENALGFASYWRNSLADAESGKGSFERKDAKNFTHWHGIAAGRLDEAIVSKFFEGEKDDVETVDVVLRPKVYFRLCLTAVLQVKRGVPVRHVFIQRNGIHLFFPTAVIITVAGVQVLLHGHIVSL